MWALPLNSASLQIGPQQSRARSGRSEPLTARTDLESSATRERGFKSEGEGPLEEAPGELAQTPVETLC